MTRHDTRVQRFPYYFSQSCATRHSCNYGSTRLVCSSMCPVRHVRGCEILVHRSSANQRLPVLETNHIPLEHTGLILGRVNSSIEERVAEPLQFGLPSFTLKLRTRLRFLPLAPFNARCEGFGLIFHGSPPLLGRTSADCAACLPRLPLMWPSQWPSLSRFKNTLVKSHRRCQGFNTSCPVPGSLYVSISCSDSIAHHRDNDRILEEGQLGESAGQTIQPKTNCPAR